MTQGLLLIVLAAAGAYFVRRTFRSTTPSRRPIDVGAVSTGWIAEHRREEPR